MKNKIILFAVTFLLNAAIAFAHEGHDKTPGAVAAPHGGVIQGTNSLYWELVNVPGGIKLYPLTHDVAAIALREVSLSGTVKFPKKSKGDAVKFMPESDHFVVKIDAKGAYRYTLDLSFTYKGKKEKVKFQVEPQN